MDIINNGRYIAMLLGLKQRRQPKANGNNSDDCI